MTFSLQKVALIILNNYENTKQIIIKVIVIIVMVIQSLC